MSRAVPPSSRPGSASSAERPWWMTALSVVCGVGLAVSVFRDLAFPENRGVEVWLGFEVTGRAAILTAPLHWAVFAAGAWGFWKRRSWMWPWAPAYLFYVAASHLVWSEVSPSGRGWVIGLVQAAAISAVAILLLRARATFRRAPG